MAENYQRLARKARSVRMRLQKTKDLSARLWLLLKLVALYLKVLKKSNNS
jgi:hypothetical protein